MAFSADGLFLASGSDDCTVRIWEVQTGHKQFVLYHDQDAVKRVDFNDTGYQVITRTLHFTCTWDLKHILVSTSADHSKTKIAPINQVSEVYTSECELEGVSDGFYCGMMGSDRDRWLFMSAIPTCPSDAIPSPIGYSKRRARRVTFIPQEYQISKLAFRHDHVAFGCFGGQVLLLDISRLKEGIVAGT